MALPCRQYNTFVKNATTMLHAVKSSFTLRLHGISWGVKTTCFKAHFGVSLGGVRILRVIRVWTDYPSADFHLQRHGEGPGVLSNSGASWNGRMPMVGIPARGFDVGSRSVPYRTELGGGFKYLWFSTLPGEMIQFDWCFSNGLKP